jgi:uncharacterized protein YlaN (UPF0358 family)
MADISVYPGYQPKALESLRKEAERFFSFEEIRVRNLEEPASWEEYLSAQCLPSINEEV